MGNTSSVEEEEPFDQSEQSQLDDVDPDENLLDFSPLFDTDALHKALISIKEPPGDILSRQKDALIKWLQNLVGREETTINLVQFVDFLTPKASREEAIAVFNDLDAEGEGLVDITWFLSKLKDTAPEPMQALQPCCELPGPLEVYLPDKPSLSKSAKKILQFIHRNRVDSEKLVMPILSQIDTTIGQRLKLVKGRYCSLKQREADQALLGNMDGEGTDEENGKEKLLIKKCFSAVTVSTNNKTVENLLNPRMDSYWQSNGSPRSHYIRIHMLPGVMVKDLSVSVNSSDDSYMPKILTVSVGNSAEGNLREIKKLTVPRETVGKFVLVQNLSTEYRYIQINIKGCHNDGCDVRIRGLHIKGCKYIKEVQPTVLDTMAIWYLGIVGSTAREAMPIAPQLRQLILNQSKTALSNLPPLSISPFSPSKPDFLSSFVIEEMRNFLTSICLTKDSSVDLESLEVLLSFAVAHGNINHIIDVIMALLEHLSSDMKIVPLLLKMESILNEKLFKHAESLKMVIVSCDGGQKDDDHKPEIIFSNTANAAKYYLSETDKKVVTVTGKTESNQLFCATKLKVKVQSGDQGAMGGLVFLTEEEPSKLGEERLKAMESWTAEDYKNKEKRETADIAPIAYFELDKESNEMEFIPDTITTGRYLTVKFLGPRKEDAERVGVHSVQVYGHHYTEASRRSMQFLKRMSSVADIPPEARASGRVGVATIITRLLHFLGSLMRDMSLIQARRKAASLDITVLSEAHLAVENLALEKIWKLYLAVKSSELPNYATLLCLYLLRTSLPYIKPQPSKEKPKSDEAGGTSSPEDEGVAGPSAVLLHLCGLLDSTQTEEQVSWLAQDIVTEGVVVFFPDAKARKGYLLSMIDSILGENQPKSWWLKFEALCHYFSKSDSKSVLSLPSKPADVTEENMEPALNILSTMIVVAKREALACLNSGEVKPDDLTRLLSALQASLFFWCQGYLMPTTPEGKDASKETEVDTKAVGHFIAKYVDILSEHCVELLRECDKSAENLSAQSKSLEKTVLGRVLPELLVCLGTMVDADLDRLSLLSSLQPLLVLLTSINSRLPSPIAEAGKKDAATAAESIVGVWNRESPHNYENNTRTTEDFHCPSAVRFTVEFDSRCRTERRYDYLEFWDESGNKHRCDGEVGGERWPSSLDFKGQKVQFKFYSDSSNNEWGYKFTMRAYGHAYTSLHWLNDLNVSLCYILGQLCSSLLTTRPHTPAPVTTVALPTNGEKDKEKREEQQQQQDELLVHSDLWKTLFRGGYMIGKLTRSLSGAYSARPADTELSAVLNDLANGPEGPGKKLVNLCQESQKGQYYGGPKVNTAVNAVFAALIWHSQECREELTKFAEDNPVVTNGLLNAFKFAEFVRRDLVEARQKLIEAKEKEEDEEKKAAINEDAPVEACQEKANFLLKFSGVYKHKKAEPDGSQRIRPSWGTKGKNWSKISGAVSTVGKLKQQLQDTSEREKIKEKYPSFGLVLKFVRSSSISVDRINSLLDQRSDMARMVAQGYNFCAEVVRTLGVENLFELSGLTFLQQLLVRQRHFPKHYAAKLDGCGLDLENQVRKAYRSLIMQLIEAYKNYSKPPTKDHAFSRLLILLYLLHLLDFTWQDYDHTLLNELNLPELYLTSAINCLGVKEQHRVDKFEGEEEMLRRYKVHMELKEKFMSLDRPSNFMSLVDQAEGEQELKDTHMFIIAMAIEYPLRIGIQCDGCQKTIQHESWYRDLDSMSFDLCTSCFETGEGSRPDQFDKDHRFLLMGKFGCDGCKMDIITHRFHSQTRDNFDLCMGCFRKEEAEYKAARKELDDWTVYLLTEQPATSKSNVYLSMLPNHSPGVSFKDGVMMKLTPSVDLGIYAQHHCWLLFSSLTLSMANSVNQTSGSEVEYLQQACSTMQWCLQFLAFVLRAALLSKLEEADNKILEEEEKKKKEEAAKEAEKDEKTTPSDENRIVVDSQATPAATPTGDGGVAVTPTEGVDSACQPGDTKDSTEDEKMEVDQVEASEKKENLELAADQDRGAESENSKKDEKMEEEESISKKEKIEDMEVDSPLAKTVEADSTRLPAGENDPVTLAARQPREGDGRIGELEKSYGVLMMEKALGLLTAILPHDMTLSPWIQHRQDIEVFLVHELLPIVLQLSRCSALTESQRLQSLLVTAQYLAHLNPEVADRVIDMAHGSTPSTEVLECRTHGTQTVQFLFSMGAEFLMKSQFSGAATCAESLLLLSKALPWKSAVGLTLGQCLQKHPNEMDLSSIFGLLVISGFPRIPREGSVVHTSLSDKPSRVVLMSVDNNNGTGIDVSTRKPVSIKLSDYELEDSLRGCIDKTKLPILLNLLKVSLSLAKQESEKQVEHMWVLALALKALHFIIQDSTSDDVIKGLLEAGMIPVLVKLASKPTHINKKWYLTDLEVLGISSYLPQQEDKEAPEKNKEADAEASKKEATPPVETSTKEEAAEESGKDEMENEGYRSDIMEGIGEDDVIMLKTMAEIFMCPLSVLRALYDNADGDMPRFVASTEQYIDSEGKFKPSEEITELAQKWELSGTGRLDTLESQVSMEDTGVTRISPIEQDIKSMDALPEDSSIFKKAKNLLKDADKSYSGSNHKAQDDGVLKREDSYKLLWEELGKKEPAATRESLCKTLQGVAVLRARLVLATLLSNWPQEGRRLSTSFLGCSDIIHYFCLLDLLLHQQTLEEREKLLVTVLTRGEVTEMMSLAVTAAQCMNKVAISREIREFTHKGKADGKLKEKGKIVINNATSLDITYFPVNGQVVFSNGEGEVYKKVTGSATKQTGQEKHTIPGDTVHFEVDLDPVSEAKYPRYSFTVTGTQEGRFETGFLVLSLLMDKKDQFSSWLPVEQLWPLLISVACQHTGRQRLKVIELLMEIINLQSGEGGEKKKMQLSALKPLWQLYTTIIKEYDSKNKTQQSLSPDIVRVLTELFLCVENLSKDWGISQELMVETLTKEGLNRWLEKGISNVAFASIALGLDNLASKTFLEEKKNYKQEKKGPSMSSILEAIANRTEDDDDMDDDDDEDSYDTYSDDDDDDELDSDYS